MRLRRLLGSDLPPYTTTVWVVVLLQTINTFASLTLPALNADLIDRGVLEVAVDLPEPQLERAGTVILCHPHPLHGGNMFATVIDHLFTDLSAAGIACCRFNFRGVNGSDGRHDYGRGEQLDALAAIEHMADLSTDLPVWSIGWSFGADVSRAVAHPRLAGWYAVAPPLKMIDPATMIAATDERPTVLAVPEHDQFRPPASAAEATNEWVNHRVVTLPMTDHFVSGQLGTVAALARDLVLGAHPQD